MLNNINNSFNILMLFNFSIRFTPIDLQKCKSTLYYNLYSI